MRAPTFKCRTETTPIAETRFTAHRASSVPTPLGVIVPALSRMIVNLANLATFLAVLEINARRAMDWARSQTRTAATVRGAFKANSLLVTGIAAHHARALIILGVEYSAKNARARTTLRRR